MFAGSYDYVEKPCNLQKCADQGRTAMASISTRAPLGSAATPKAARAGRTGPVKNWAYTSLTATKSLMSASSTVVLTTSAKLRLAAFRISPMLVRLWRAWAWMSPSTSCPVAGTRGIWPEMKTWAPASSPVETA